MKPSVVFVNAEGSLLLSIHKLPPSLHRLSLRYMIVDASWRVWICGQDEGDVMDEVPVLLRLDSDAGLAPADLPDDVSPMLGKYVGSAAIGADGRTLALASRRPGRAVSSVPAKPAGLGTAPMFAPETIASRPTTEPLTERPFWPGAVGLRPTASECGPPCSEHRVLTDARFA